MDSLDVYTDRMQHLKESHKQVQIKTFGNWINGQFAKAKSPHRIRELVLDIQDGTILIYLLEILYGSKIKKENPRIMQRIHFIQNIESSLTFLKIERKIKLVNINASDIVDGNTSITLGLIWMIILDHQIDGSYLSYIEPGPPTPDILAMSVSKTTNLASSTSERPRASTATAKPKSVPFVSPRKRMMITTNSILNNGYNLKVKDFGPSWRDGFVFNAIIHSMDSDLIDMERIQALSNYERLDNAFTTAEEAFDIPKILDPTDVDVPDPDEKSIMTYASQLLKYRASAPASKKTDEKGSDVPNPDSTKQLDQEIIPKNSSDIKSTEIEAESTLPTSKQNVNCDPEAKFDGVSSRSMDAESNNGLVKVEKSNANNLEIVETHVPTINNAVKNVYISLENRPSKDLDSDHVSFASENSPNAENAESLDGNEISQIKTNVEEDETNVDKHKDDLIFVLDRNEEDILNNGNPNDTKIMNACLEEDLVLDVNDEVEISVKEKEFEALTFQMNIKVPEENCSIKQPVETNEGYISIDVKNEIFEEAEFDFKKIDNSIHKPLLERVEIKESEVPNEVFGENVEDYTSKNVQGHEKPTNEESIDILNKNIQLIEEPKSEERLGIKGDLTNFTDTDKVSVIEEFVEVETMILNGTGRKSEKNIEESTFENIHKNEDSTTLDILKTAEEPPEMDSIVVNENVQLTEEPSLFHLESIETFEEPKSENMKEQEDAADVKKFISEEKVETIIQNSRLEEEPPVLAENLERSLENASKQNFLSTATRFEDSTEINFAETNFGKCERNKDDSLKSNEDPDLFSGDKKQEKKNEFKEENFEKYTKEHEIIVESALSDSLSKELSALNEGDLLLKLDSFEGCEESVFTDKDNKNCNDLTNFFEIENTNNLEPSKEVLPLHERNLFVKNVESREPEKETFLTQRNAPSEVEEMKTQENLDIQSNSPDIEDDVKSSLSRRVLMFLLLLLLIILLLLSSSKSKSN